MSAEASRGRVTDLLGACRRGESGAFDALVPATFGELRRVAQRQLAREARGHTLQPTALVAELYLRWTGRAARWQDRAHFLSIAAAQMRRILVDHARRKKATKRGGHAAPAPWTEAVATARSDADSSSRAVRLLDLDRALRRLESMDPELVRLVELRFFSGLSARETGETLGLTERTVMRRWAWVRAWLLRELGQEIPRHANPDLAAV
ncbi:MAG: ECF-type sigma factor [Holophagales bacterium]|nr:ECF-type sigma factor [Holophagales bacterium]